MEPSHSAYIIEAQRLQREYASQIHILIGFEAEFIRPSYKTPVLKLANPAGIDYFIGSLHHVHSIPIDYNADMYQKAVAASGGTEEKLYEAYYDLQHQMLVDLRPVVVGHFDLVRLMSEEPERDIRKWSGVWERVRRNLMVVLEQGGWLECNSAGLRKGLEEPYPCKIIAEVRLRNIPRHCSWHSLWEDKQCSSTALALLLSPSENAEADLRQEWLSMGGKFTLSDDSHGIEQVATNYSRTIAYLQSLGVQQVWTLRRKAQPRSDSSSKAELEEVGIQLEEIRQQFKE